MNKYSQMQKQHYEANRCPRNHLFHNENPDYWNILLGDIKDSPARWNGKRALDFGCGGGRNVLILHSLADWASADGCDISSMNIRLSQEYLDANCIDANKSALFTTNGTHLDGMESDCYDFVMSAIVLQHICVHEIRFSILEDMFRVLKEGGLLSFQMGFGSGAPDARGYYENYYDACATNSRVDVKVSDPSQVVGDLTKIGFKDISFEIRPSFADRHEQWIFVKAFK